MARPKKVEIKDGFIYFEGVKKASFDNEAHTLLEFFNDGEDEKSELLQALKDDDTYGWDSEDLSDTRIKNARDIWEIVPEAPRPQPTLGLGDKHPLIYDFIEKNYPRILKIRYRKGRYDKDMAGKGVNKTQYRDDLGQVSEAGLKKMKGKRAELARHAQEYLDSTNY